MFINTSPDMIWPSDLIDEMYRSIGCAIMSFGAIDTGIATLILSLAQTDYAAAEAIVTGNRSYDARFSVLNTLLAFRLGDLDPRYPQFVINDVAADLFKKIEIKFNKTKKLRNTMAHGALHIGRTQRGEPYVRLVGQFTHTATLAMLKGDQRKLPGHSASDVAKSADDSDFVYNKLMDFAEIMKHWGTVGPTHSNTVRGVRALAADFRMEIPENLTDLKTAPQPRPFDPSPEYDE